MQASTTRLVRKLPNAVIPYRYRDGYRSLQRLYQLIKALEPLDFLTHEHLELNDGKLHVLYYAQDMGGCGFYRAFQPASILHASTRVTSYASPVLCAALAHWAHIIVFQRTFSGGTIETAKKLLPDAVLLFDIDDDLLHIPTWNPAHAGHNSRKVRERLQTMLKLTRETFVTNDALGRLMLREGARAFRVIPNAVRAEDFTPRPNTDGTVRIGWAGSATHYRDLQHALPALARLQREDARVRIVVMGWKGDTDAGNVFARAGVRIEYHPFVQVHRFADALSRLRLDIGIAPLEPCTFNDSKSPIKWEEYSALGIPTVASPVAPYMEIEHGVTGMLAQDAEAFYQHLHLLVENPTVRRRMGNNAQRYVTQQYGEDATLHRLEDAFLSHLHAVPK